MQQEATSKSPTQPTPGDRKGALLSIDLGCGPSKRAGYLGVDMKPAPCVDHVVDFDAGPLPFGDGTVDRIFSSHCFEHLKDPLHLMREVSRVAVHGAELELWVPYGWNNDAFLYDHRTFFNETHFHHMSFLFPQFWADELGAQWKVREVVLALEETVLEDLRLHGDDLAFALRYYKNVVREIGLMVELDKRGGPAEPIRARRSYAPDRNPALRKNLDDMPRGKGLRARAGRALSVLVGRKQ